MLQLWMHQQRSFLTPFSHWFLCRSAFQSYSRNFLKWTFREKSWTFSSASPIVFSIACIISFSCFVEKPTERVDLSRFHVGMSEIRSSVWPKIGPPPMPCGLRLGKALKFEANTSWISFGSTSKWSQIESERQLAQNRTGMSRFLKSFPVRIVGVRPL